MMTASSQLLACLQLPRASCHVVDCCGLPAEAAWLSIANSVKTEINRNLIKAHSLVSEWTYPLKGQATCSNLLVAANLGLLLAAVIGPSEMFQDQHAGGIVSVGKAQIGDYTAKILIPGYAG